MHTWNKLLPAVERDGLHDDEADSLNQLLRSMTELQAVLNNKGCILGNKEIGTFLRLIHTHNTLKYTLKASQLDSLLNLLMDMYLSKQLSVPMLIRVLDTLKGLCKKAKCLSLSPGCENSSVQLAFRFSYLPLWEEIMRILSRGGRDVAVASEHQLSELLTAMIDFLHGAREFIRTDVAADAPDSIDLLVKSAMLKLQDLRYPTCMEGVLMLINCLPTDYAHYETLLPRWLECWIGGSVTSASGTSECVGGLNHNAHWDYAWLTLFCRARKHCPHTTNGASTGFAWQSLLPLLITKASELMLIPASAGVEGAKSAQNSDFPHAFHAHYARLLLVQSAHSQGSDARTMALKKLAKLLHFITSAHLGPLVAAMPLSISPPACTVAALAAAQVPAEGEVLMVLPGAVDVMMLMQSLRTYFYPSNVGNWTHLLANFFLTYVLQLCRQVGHSLASTVTGTVPACRRYQAPLHLPTVQYVVTNLLPFCLEGLYSKNPYMTQYCSACIKNLVAVHPTVCGPIVLPFLLAALDPAAVSQAHQAPVAMQTIGGCFRGLMYPQPVLLPYLPDILRLSLPGIEPSDVMKTSITLNLYCTVLAWLPTTLRSVDAGKNGTDAVLPSYLEVIQNGGVDATGAIPASAKLSVDLLNDQLQVLSEYLSSEWCAALMSRLFALLEAQEVVVEGAKPSPLAGAVGQVASYLFQALRDLPGLPATHPAQEKQVQLRRSIQSQVRKFFLTTTPLNGVKGSAKLVEAMVTSDPSILVDVLTELLDTTSNKTASTDGTIATTLLAAFSADKVAFRLRLAGGACRSATSAHITPCLAMLLQPIITSTAYSNHEEKIVRVATGKLLKDVLKGSTSIYPTGLEPVYVNNCDRVVGFPTLHSDGNVHWHVPTADSLHSSIGLLKVVITDSMRDAQQSLLDVTATNSPLIASSHASTEDLAQTSASAALNTPITTSGGNPGNATASAAMAFKKSEELLVSRLGMIEKALRGAAEVLGDVTYEAQYEQSGTAVSDWRLLSTGRDQLITGLQDLSDRVYLQSLRLEVLKFLAALQDTMHTIPSAHPYASLKNNITIQTLWVQLFNLVVTRRMACLKDVDNVRKYMKYTLKGGRTSISNVVYHRMKTHAQTESLLQAVGYMEVSAPQRSAWRTELGSLEYWRNHDSSTSGIACMAWIKHVQRCKILSSDALRRCDSPTFLRCLQVLVQQLCVHEYDEIRKVGLKYFDLISTRYGSKMEVTVQEVLNSLQKSALSYSEVSGALTVLGQARVQKRILGDPALLQHFLKTMLLRSQTVILTATEEADKREKLMLKVVDVLLKYGKKWSASPALTGTEDNAFMLNLALAAVGCGDADGLNPLTTAIVSGDGKAGNALGLRFEAFAAFMVLQIIGRPGPINLPAGANKSGDATQSTALWQYVISSLSNGQQHGQPSQAISLAALCRLAWITAQQTQAAQDGNTVVDASCGDFVRNLLSPTSANSVLKAVIVSAAQSHPRTSEDGTSAQWGKGIEQVLQASSFLKTVVPRRFNGLKADHGFYSRSLRKEDAALYMSLAMAGLLCSSKADTYSVANLTALFGCTVDMPHANESEARMNNTTRAEVFAGVLRAYRSSSTAAADAGTNAEVEAVFLQTLKEGIEKVSLDYARDWEEALCFAYSDAPCRPTEAIPAYILERLQQVVLTPTAASNAPTASNTAEAGAESATTTSGDQSESFTNQSKILQLTCALLQADQEACFTTGATSQLGGLLTSILLSQAEHALVSPYRSTRSDIAFVLTKMAENDAASGVVSQGVIALCKKLASACQVNAIQAPAEGEETAEPTKVSALQVQLFKNAAETVCIILRCAVHNLPMWRFNGAWRELFAAALIGAGSMTSSAIETAKICHDACLLVANCAIRNSVTSAVTSAVASKDLVSELLGLLLATSQDKTTPLHSRETLMKCVSQLMGNNWYTLSTDERKVCRDIFAVGIDDVKPEVQQLAVAGMVSYLATYKTVPELAAIAAVYTKNSDIFATREKKLKKQNQSQEVGTAKLSAKVDIKHQNTIMMMSCVILATPYDMPSTYVPALLTSFVRHAATPSLKDIVTRTVQLFKGTHQDRWDEFKTAFTTDQLDELQGTGAAHYYS